MLYIAYLYLKENLLLYLSSKYESYSLFSYIFYSAINLVGPFYNYPYYVPSLILYN
jgi:hypothetical protein